MQNFSEHTIDDKLSYIDTEAYRAKVTQTEILETGEWISKMLTLTVRLLRRDDKLREKIFPDEAPNSLINKPTNEILTPTRLNKILYFMSNQYIGELMVKDEEGEYLDKYGFILEHWDEIINMSSSYFIEDLGVDIRAQKEQTTEGTNRQGETDSDFEHRSTKESEENSARESWQYEVREVTVEQNMSQALKSFLGTLPMMRYERVKTNDGKYVWRATRHETNKMGMHQFLNRHIVVNAILNKLHSARTSEEMINRLRDEKNVSKFPWFPLVADYLEQNKSIIPLFYRTFRKNKTSYFSLSPMTVSNYDYFTKTRSKSLKLRGVDVFDRQRKYAIYDIIKNNIINNHPKGFFIYVDGNPAGAIKGLNPNSITYQMGSSKRMVLKNQSIFETIVTALQELGFDNLEAELRTLKPDEIKRLYWYVQGLAENIIKEGRARKGPFVPYEMVNGFDNPYSLLIDKLLPFMDVDYEMIAYDSGKNYSVYTEPSFLGDLIESISEMSAEESEKFIREKYQRTQLFFKDARGVEYYTSLLIKELLENANTRKNLKRVVLTSYDGVSYKDMSTQEYILADLGMFMNGYLHIPILSDKSSAEYINLGTELTLDQAVDSVVNFALFELKRIRDVFWWEHNGRPKIDNFIPDLPQSIREKLKNKDDITFEDILDEDPKTGVKKLKPFMKAGGSAFRYFTFLNNEFTSETKLGQKILDYINYKVDDNFFDTITADLEAAAREGLQADFEKYIEYMDNQFGGIEMLNEFIPIVNDFGATKVTDADGTNRIRKEVREKLEKFYYSTRTAAADILAMTIIDPAFYKSTVDLQKRYAQVYSMVQRPDTSATFIDKNGIERKLSADGKHRYIIVEDKKVKSAVLEIITAGFDTLIDKEKNPNKKKFLERQKANFIKIAKSITITDGQGISSIHGYFKKIGMLNGVTSDLRDAYYRIMDGNYSNEDLDYVFQAIKPFVFAWESVDIGNGENFISPVQIKDSESVLLMSSVLAAHLRSQGLLDENNILEKLYKFMDETAYDENGEWTGTGIDTIVFHSAVKGGGYNVVDLNNSTNIDEDLRNAYRHEHDFYDWGKQQEMPEHLQDYTQAMPSQTRALTPTNISDDSKVIVGGKEKTGKEAKEEYFEKLHKDFSRSIKETEKVFGVGQSRKKKVRKLSNFLKNFLQGQSTTSAEEIKAVSLKNGEFNMPLSYPVFMQKLANGIFSKIKNKVNKEKFPGGPVIQVSTFGYKAPQVVFNKAGKFQYFECYVTCPSSVLEEALTIKDAKGKSTGLLMSVDEALKRGIITEDDLKAITSRIPVEAKYSMYPLRIKAFLPKILGEQIILPDEMIALSGSDFDADKQYLETKYTEAMGDQIGDVEKLKNSIIDYQFGFLTSEDAFVEMFSGQNVSEWKEIAAEIDPNYRDIDLDMTMPEAQYYFFEQNIGGKQMLAISIANNDAHALGTEAGIKIKIPKLTFNGVPLAPLFDADGFIRLDPIESPIDNSNINQILAGLVGASVDNNKNYIVPNIGYNKTIGSYFVGLLRLGIPIKTVSFIMSQGIIKKLTRESNLTDSTFDAVLSSEVGKRIESLGIEKQDIENHLSSIDFTDEKLLENIRTPEDSYDSNIVLLIYSLKDVVNEIFSVSKILNLNSISRAVGKSIWNVLNNKTNIDKLNWKSQEDEEYSILPPDTLENITAKIPFLNDLVNIYTELVPNIMREDFIPFAGSYSGLMDYMHSIGFDMTLFSDKGHRKLFNEFMVYLSTGNVGRNGGVLFDGSYKGRKKAIYSSPLDALYVRKQLSNMFLNRLGFKMKAAWNVNIPLLRSTTGLMDAKERDMMSASWAALLNPEQPDYELTSELSDNLLEYNIFRGGFFFDPQGFMNLAPNVAKEHYKDGKYRELSNAKNWQKRLEDKDYFNFLGQYLRNHPYGQGVQLLDDEYIKANYMGGLSNGREYLIPHEKERAKIRKILLLKDSNYNLYLRDSDEDFPIFYKVTRLGFFKMGFEYNRMEDATKVKTVNTRDNFEEFQTKVVKISSIVFADSTNNEVDEIESGTTSVKTLQKNLLETIMGAGYRTKDSTKQSASITNTTAIELKPNKIIGESWLNALPKTSNTRTTSEQENRRKAIKEMRAIAEKYGIDPSTITLDFLTQKKQKPKV